MHYWLQFQCIIRCWSEENAVVHCLYILRCSVQSTVLQCYSALPVAVAVHYQMLDRRKCTDALILQQSAVQSTTVLQCITSCSAFLHEGQSKMQWCTDSSPKYHITTVHYQLQQFQCITRCWTGENALMLASYKLQQKKDGGKSNMQAFSQTTSSSSSPVIKIIIGIVISIVIIIIIAIIISIYTVIISASSPICVDSSIYRNRESINKEVLLWQPGLFD